LEVLEILTDVKRAFPNIKTFVWTGYTREELENKYAFEWIVKDIDVLITGRYIQELRDITLKWRGSSNQEILYKGIDY
jgi:anaerobic ribonucleoside-triphosphate reductase activating protein